MTFAILGKSCREGHLFATQRLNWRSLKICLNAILFSFFPFILSSLLISLGLQTLFFFILGAFTMEGFMAHILLIASAYDRADSAARLDFLQLSQISIAMILAAVTGVRFSLLKKGK